MKLQMNWGELDRWNEKNWGELMSEWADVVNELLLGLFPRDKKALPFGLGPLVATDQSITAVQPVQTNHDKSGLSIIDLTEPLCESHCITVLPTDCQTDLFNSSSVRSSVTDFPGRITEVRPGEDNHAISLRCGSSFKVLNLKKRVAATA